MSTFEELKKKAEAQVAQDQAATESWVKAHRGALILGTLLGLIIGFVLAKIF